LKSHIVLLGSVGGEKHGFDITWVNCGALMNQFFGNKRTMLFARKEDIQYATEEGAEGLRLWIQNKGGLESSEAIAFCHKSMPLSFCKTLLEHNIIYSPS
jgi:hypothetical protein